MQLPALWLIHGREPNAIDASQHRGGRPRYLISKDAITEFEQKRQAKQPAKAARKRREKGDDGVIEFF